MGLLIWGSYLVFFVVVVCFWPCHTGYGILVPRPGIKHMPPAWEAQSLNRWTIPGVLITWQISSDPQSLGCLIFILVSATLERITAYFLEVPQVT